jgi:anti-sigma B factor antagonist
MEMTNEHINGVTLLTLSGHFDVNAAPTVEKIFQNIQVDSTPYIIINLSNVNFIDSTGLATLITGEKRCRKQNGCLVLVNIQKTVMIIFEVTNLNKILTILDTQEEAFERVQHLQES